MVDKEMIEEVGDKTLMDIWKDMDKEQRVNGNFKWKDGDAVFEEDESGLWEVLYRENDRLKSNGIHIPEGEVSLFDNILVGPPKSPVVFDYKDSEIKYHRPSLFLRILYALRIKKDPRYNGSKKTNDYI